MFIFHQIRFKAINITPSRHKYLRIVKLLRYKSQRNNLIDFIKVFNVFIKVKHLRLANWRKYRSIILYLKSI